jgi:hypothetical protein
MRNGKMTPRELVFHFSFAKAYTKPRPETAGRRVDREPMGIIKAGFQI